SYKELLLGFLFRCRSVGWGGRFRRKRLAVPLPCRPPRGWPTCCGSLMSVRIESQAEPLPGYRLIERLGGGGLGEVWKCEALGGIPREELLAYMEETAEALDLMNIQYQLQHLDIKPQNIFLVHNHVKVADFGLVKDLEGSQASVTGGITPVYAAPETFDGKVSRFSDQYSFAIVYQEMLTGVRPFSGNNVRQLIMQHLSAVPDVSPLPVDDRPAIFRS